MNQQVQGAVSAQIREAARELLRRRRCWDSLHAYAMSIDIPTVPTPGMRPDEDLVGPSEYLMAAHHAAIYHTLQQTMTTPFGRCLIMAPPGAAKSLCTVVGTTWFMGRNPGAQIIYTSYGDDLAEKQSRRAQDIVRQEQYGLIFNGVSLLKDSVKEWALTGPGGAPLGGSEFMAKGLMSGITGSRADGAVVDDPVKGRQEADSETTRQTTLDSYQDNLLSRLKPGAWVVFIMTRWHEADLMGSILPDDYDGRSGPVLCKDGLVWNVLNIQAKCERHDDPLGRKPGEYLWPEYTTPAHWQLHEKSQGREAQRKWASLYQQRPTPQGDGRFHESMIDYYKPGTQPPTLAYVGASDHAVTEGGNDFSEAGVFGVDYQGDLWEVDWWHDQCDTGKASKEVVKLMKRWRTPMWFNEGGVIDKAMAPLLNMEMRAKKAYVDRRAMPSIQDKVAKCSSFQGLAAINGEKADGSGTFHTGKIHMRDNANSRRVVAQLVALPAGRYDDAADVCGLIGRAIDQFPIVPAPYTKPKNTGIKPFTAAWLEYEENPTEQVRYR